MNAEEQMKSLRAKIARLQDALRRALEHIDAWRKITDELDAIAEELSEENQRLRAEIDALKRRDPKKQRA